MRITFNNPILEQLAENDPIGKPQFPQTVVRKFRHKLSVLAQTDSMRALSRIKGLNLEALKGSRAGSFSIRIDLKYRLIFRIDPDDILIAEEIIVDELSNHYR